MDPQELKRIIHDHPRPFRIAAALYNCLRPGNRLRARGLRLSFGISLLKGVKIYCSGTNNVIEVGNLAQLSRCTVSIAGNNNRIRIGDRVCMDGATLCMEDDGNEIVLGERTYLNAGDDISVMEGTKVTFGKNCLVSSNVRFRTGDSHSVLDENGRRTNPSRDIAVGNHVWFGTQVLCLKGVSIADDCIAAAGSVLTRGCESRGTILAGNPARPVRTGVNWDEARLPCAETEEEQLNNRN